LMNCDELKVGVGLLCCVSFFVFLLGCLFVFISPYVFLVALAAGISSVGALVEITLVRDGRVRYIAIYRLSLPVLSFSFALLYSILFDVNAYKIALSYYIGMTLVIVIAMRGVIFPLFTRLSRSNVRQLLTSYKRFPKFIGPGLIFSAAAANLPIIIGLHFFGGAAISAYTLAYRFVMAPMNILGLALGQAYTSKLSESYRNNNSLSTTLKLDTLLFSLAVIISLMITLIFPWVARLLFSKDHAEITEYAFAMIPLIFSMLSVGPLTNLFQFTNRQSKILLIHFITFLSSLVAFFIGVLFNNFLMGVIVFSLFTLLRYVWVYYEILQVRKCKE